MTKEPVSTNAFSLRINADWNKTHGQNKNIDCVETTCIVLMTVTVNSQLAFRSMLLRKQTNAQNKRSLHYLYGDDYKYFNLKLSKLHLL